MGVCVLLLAAALVLCAPARGQRFEFGPLGTRFRTEPDIVRERVTVTDIINDRSRLSPGYLFMAPRTYFQGWGAKIYDIHGMLIWDGNYTAGFISQNFFACDYDGKVGEHLCWHESSRLGLPAKGQKLADMVDFNTIYDNTYKRVGEPLRNTGNLSTQPDAHEFNLVDKGKTFIANTYRRVPWDMTQWNGPNDGFIHDSCFQEFDIHKPKPFWTWCYSDNLPIESAIWPKTENQTHFNTGIAGRGTWISPWDFYHLNSVDKNEEGDYLLSGRHADQIMKLAGPGSPNGEPGRPIWRLGGTSNEFEMNFNFTRQHHVRFVSTSPTETVITMFDNAWEGEADFQSSAYSSGKLVRVNNVTKKAELIQEYAHPYGRTSRAGGSTQEMANHNIFVGWGGLREVTEYAYDGTVLYHAVLKCSEQAPLINYRNFKAPWVGKPHFPPKLLAYCRSCGRTSAPAAPLIAHASWNGATEITHWRFSSGYHKHGPWNWIDTVEKDGFETRLRASEHFVPFIRAEALDKDGAVLGAVVAATFVPIDSILGSCDGDGCNTKPELYYGAEYDAAGECPQGSLVIPLVLLAFLVLGFEIATWTLAQTLYFQARDAAGAYAPLAPYADGGAQGAVSGDKFALDDPEMNAGASDHAGADLGSTTDEEKT